MSVLGAGRLIFYQTNIWRSATLVKKTIGVSQRIIFGSKHNNSYIFNNRGDDRMSDKKQLVILYAVLLVTIILGSVWMLHEVDSRVAEDRRMGFVPISAFCSDGLAPQPTFCHDDTQSTLKTAVNAPNGAISEPNDIQPAGGYRLVQPVATSQYHSFNEGYTGGQLKVVSQ